MVLLQLGQRIAAAAGQEAADMPCSGGENRTDGIASTLRTRMRTVPCSAIASRAFTARLISLEHQAGGAVGRCTDGLDMAVLSLVARAAVTQHAHRTGDDLQKMVEIVGNTAGQLANGLQLLQLPQLLARPHPFGMGQPRLLGDGFHRP